LPPDNLLRLDDVVELMFKCAKALHYAHSRGVIHRDIKPSNIMLTTESDVRIIDFGIALVAGSEISRIEGIAGSPSYMSPEQVQSLELTNRSDLYSLGAVMYELLTGVRPFRAGNLAKLLHQIVYATPAPIHTLRADVPEEIENVVAVAMQKDPARRYDSGLDFAAELTRVHQTIAPAVSREMDQQEQFGCCGV
jgi:serine/threonine protein kinase